MNKTVLLSGGIHTLIVPYIFLFLTIGSSFTQSQTCEKWIQSPSECIPVLQKYATTSNSTDINIWLPPNITQSYLAAYAAATIQSFNNPLVEPGCRSVFIEFVCLEAFHACFPIPVSQTSFVFLAQLTCKSVCQEVNQKCASLAVQMKEMGMEGSLPDCDSAKMVTGETGYPDTVSYFPGVPVPIPCVNGDGIEVPITVTEDDIDCGDLIFDPSVTPPCSVPCRFPVFSKKNWDANYTLFVTLSCGGFVLTGILVVVFGCQRRYWRYPKNMHLFISFSSFLVYAGILIGFFYDIYMRNQDSDDRTGCHEDKITRKGVQDPVCGLQGALVLFGSIAVILWWFLITLYLFVVIYMTSIVRLPFGSFLKEHIGRISYIIGWIIPVATSVILLAGDQVGFSGTIPWCFIVPNPDNRGWELGAYYAPIFMSVLFGSFMVVAVIIRLYLISVSVEGYESGGKKKSKVPKETYRILTFLFILLYILSFILGYRFDQMEKEGRTKKSLEAYLKCFFKNQFYPDGSECHFDDKPSTPLWFITSINVSIQGYLLFIFFGLTKANIRHVIKMIKERNFTLGSITTGERNSSSRSAPTRKSAPSGNSNHDSKFDSGTELPGDDIQMETVQHVEEEEELDSDSDSEASI